MRPVFVQALMNTLSQETRQKEQKKVGESFHDFLKTKLKSQAQQEISNEEFDSTLGMIIDYRCLRRSSELCYPQDRMAV